MLYSSLSDANNTVLRGEQAGVKYSAERQIRMWGTMADIDALVYTYDEPSGTVPLSFPLVSCICVCQCAPLALDKLSPGLPYSHRVSLSHTLAAMAQHRIAVEHAMDVATLASLLTSGLPSEGVVGSLHGAEEEVVTVWSLSVLFHAVSLTFLFSAQVRLILEDACYLSGYDPGCVGFQNGILMRGLHGAIQHYVDQALAYSDFLQYQWTIPGPVCVQRLVSRDVGHPTLHPF